jgi:hypothetical protein
VKNQNKNNVANEWKVENGRDNDGQSDGGRMGQGEGLKAHRCLYFGGNP